MFLEHVKHQSSNVNKIGIKVINIWTGSWFLVHHDFDKHSCSVLVLLILYISELEHFYLRLDTVYTDAVLYFIAPVLLFYLIYCFIVTLFIVFFIALNTEAANLILPGLSNDNKEMHHFQTSKKGNPEERFVYFRKQHGEGIIAGLHFDSVLVGLLQTSPPYPTFNLIW